MNPEQRAELKKKILKRYELYKLQYSRVRRIIKDPFRTIPWFIVNAIAHVHPFKVKYKTLWGDTMTFYIPEGNAIYYYGFFEANLTNFFVNFLQDGDVFFDIGSHVGYYSVLANKLVSPTGQTHSFEPTPRTFESLKQNMAGKPNSTVNNRAVMDTETEIEFVDYGPKYSAFNSFKNRTSDEMKFLTPPERIKVKTVSIDKYCADKQVAPTLIKIDAEGAEHIILQAMEQTLSTAKPVVSIEVAGEEEWKENCHKSINFLTSKGYLMYEIDNDGYLHPHTEQDMYRYDNLIFVHPDKLPRISSLLAK